MVRVSVPCTGRASRMRPAPIASTAEISDHQKPGICRAQNVRIRPPMPLIRNIQPRKIVTARLASGGTIIAASPRITSRMPSNRKAFQCSRTAALILDCRLVMSWGRVIEKSPDAATAQGCDSIACASAAGSNLFMDPARAGSETTARSTKVNPWLANLPGLALARCGGKPLRGRPDSMTAEKIGRRGDHQQGDADQDRHEADGHQHERHVAFRIYQPMVDRSQYEDQADKSGGAADDQQRPHPSQLAQPLPGGVGAWRVMMTDPPHQTHGKRNRAEPDQHARRPQDEPGGF